METVCKNCGATVSNTANYCTQCGARITRDTERDMFPPRNQEGQPNGNVDTSIPAGRKRRPRKWVYSLIGIACVALYLMARYDIPPFNEREVQSYIPPSNERKVQPDIPPTSEREVQPDISPSNERKAQPDIPPTSEREAQPDIPPSSGRKVQPHAAKGHISSYSQKDRFDPYTYGYMPDFYAENDDGVMLAYRFDYDVTTKGGYVAHSKTPYGTYNERSGYHLVPTDKLVVMYDFEGIHKNNANYKGHKVICVPDKVKRGDIWYDVVKVGHCAFSYCDDLEKIILPNTIRCIYDCAFSDCKNLSEIQFPDSIYYLGGALFYGDVSLKEVILPSIALKGIEKLNAVGIDMIGKENGIKTVEIDSTWINDNVVHFNTKVSLDYCRKIDKMYNLRSIWGKFYQVNMDFTGLFPYEIIYRNWKNGEEGNNKGL